MTNASRLNVSAAGGLTAAALAEFVASQRLEHAVGSSFCHLQSLDLQHNRMLAYADRPWELLLDDGIVADLAPGGGGAGMTASGREEDLPDSEPMDLDLDAPFESLDSVALSSTVSAPASTPASPGVDVFGQFLLCVLLQCPALRALDLSHCAGSERQAGVLGRGLAAALRARCSAGLAPLETVAVRGLRAFPAAVSELVSQLKACAPEKGSEGPCLPGVRNLDLSGHHFVI